MAACCAVLDTVELLENIVLNLAWHQIVVVQRVCKQWDAVIKESCLIKEALFLKECTAARITWEADSDAYGEKALIAFGSQRRFWLEFRSPKAVLNPVAYDFLTLHPSYRHEAACTEFFKSITQTTESMLTGLHRADASWRKMQLTSPPSVQVTLGCKQCQCMPWVGVDVARVRVENKDGLTVGDLVYSLSEHWYQCDTCPLGLTTGSGAVVGLGHDETGWEIIGRTWVFAG